MGKGRSSLSVRKPARAAHITLGGQVKTWRMDHGMTLADVHKLTGVSVPYLSQIENDAVLPRRETLASITERVDPPLRKDLMQRRDVVELERLGCSGAVAELTARLMAADATTQKKVLDVALNVLEGKNT